MDTLNICMKEFGFEKMMFNKMTAIRTFSPNMTFVYALIVPSLTDQLLPQLLMNQSNTLTQCRHIKPMHA